MDCITSESDDIFRWKKLWEFTAHMILLLRTHTCLGITFNKWINLLICKIDLFPLQKIVLASKVILYFHFLILQSRKLAEECGCPNAVVAGFAGNVRGVGNIFQEIPFSPSCQSIESWHKLIFTQIKEKRCETYSLKIAWIWKCWDFLSVTNSTLKENGNGGDLDGVIELLSHTSALIAIFCGPGSLVPMRTESDKRFQEIKAALAFFEGWEASARKTGSKWSKSLFSSQCREDISCTLRGFLTLCASHMRANGGSVTPGP